MKAALLLNYRLVVDVEHRLVRQTWHAPITVSAVLELWQELAADARGIAGFDTLIDLRAVRVELTPVEVRYLATVARKQPLSKRAIVTGNDADFGRMRIFEFFSALGGREYGVFRSVEEACEWIANAGCR